MWFSDLMIDVELDDGAIMPTKAHEKDAGFDLFTPVGGVVPAHGSLVVDTGVHMGIPTGYVGFIKSKSGLNVKCDIVAEGVIDAGYTGSIVVKAYNNGDNPKIFEPGDKITQIVILPIPRVGLRKVDKLDENSERGSNGFGSSGR